MKKTDIRFAALRTGLLAAMALSLTACATLGGGTPEEIVAKRAQGYWDARIKGDTKKAYRYTNNAYKLAKDERRFATSYAGTMAQGAEVQSVKCGPEKCDVGVTLKVHPPIPGQKAGTIDVYSRQTWLLEDGQWNLYLEP